ncbi:hypothetical protein WH218_12210 [Stenotrophomonas indicatrix]|uniref:hypothetical protein n=1 Tax=Stenotrophomonas indicatrix TaxID=2045451 RepID=UPI0015DF7EA3|nr:hypothetical protein [Stenotrophomonas indicatrix]MBA0099822.1 hypothetical protein [Stenotrophomonas indicatrix]
MSLKDWLLPDELQSASTASMRLFAAANQTSHFWLKQFTGMAVPFGFGVAAGVLMLNRLIKPSEMEDFREIVVGILTFVSVLAGFMVTLMLFTGRTAGAGSLSVGQTPKYIDKVTYLLFSQALTLAVHIVCAAVCLIWLLLNAIESAGVATTVMFFVALGLIVLSMARSLLLPFQIYEVHQFEFESLLESKIAERDERLASQRAQQGRSLT